jgi:hypothetical protein
MRGRGPRSEEVESERERAARAGWESTGVLLVPDGLIETVGKKNLSLVVKD